MTTMPASAPQDQATRLRAMVELWSRNDLAEASASQTPIAAVVRTCRTIAIASGKGGVGKTTLAVNMGIAMAQAGSRVTLLDADPGLANADVLCGVTPTTRLDAALGDQRRPLSTLAVRVTERFQLIPGSAGTPRMADLPSAERLHLVRSIRALEADADLIIIDTGAGLGLSSLGFAAAADRCIVVVTPEPTSIADAYAVVKSLAAMHADRAPPPPIDIVVTSAETEKLALTVHAKIAGVAERFLGFRPTLLGFVRRDDAVTRSIRAREPLMLSNARCIAARDVRRVAESLRLTAEVQSPNKSRSKRGLFGLWSGR